METSSNKKQTNLVRSRLVPQFLPVKLTPVEKADRGESSAILTCKIEELETAAKTTSTEYKGKIAAAQAEIRRLGRIVMANEEYREVMCDEMMDYRTKKVTVTRLDTGKIVSERDMDETEHKRFSQPELPLDAPDDEDAETADSGFESGDDDGPGPFDILNGVQIDISMPETTKSNIKADITNKLTSAVNKLTKNRGKRGEQQPA